MGRHARKHTQQATRWHFVLVCHTGLIGGECDYACTRKKVFIDHDEPAGHNRPLSQPSGRELTVKIWLSGTLRPQNHNACHTLHTICLSRYPLSCYLCPLVRRPFLLTESYVLRQPCLRKKNYMQGLPKNPKTNAVLFFGITTNCPKCNHRIPKEIAQ